MKVTFVNHSDSLGGASTVTVRLVEALRRLGTDARLVVARRTTSHPWVSEAAPRWRTEIPFVKEHLRILAANGFSRRTLFKISPATDGLPLLHHPWIEEANVVVLNWVNQGMLSLEEIGRIGARKPLVWTMHDMWNFTGVCHHAGTCTRFTGHCGRCPLLGRCASVRDLSFRTFSRKEALYQGTPIHFVAVSSWLAARAAESPLMHGQELTVIPNTYEPAAPAQLGRAQLGLPDDGSRLVTICAARLDDPVKGLPAAVEALNSLAGEGITAVLVGEIRHADALAGLKVPHVALGMVSDRSRLQAIFRESAAVLSASTYESFGATLLEAQAAGTTPVAFTHDGRADIITDGVSGYGADPSGGAPALAEALRRALTQPIAAETLKAAARRFSPDSIATRYQQLFRSVAEHGG